MEIPSDAARRVVWLMPGLGLWLWPSLFLSSAAVLLSPPQVAAQTLTAQTTAAGPASPVAITLPEAITRAEKNEPNFAAARAAQRSADLARGIARSALLPGAVFHNQALYTQANGATNLAGQTGNGQPSPIFIANNAVHEYASQALVTETLGVAQAANVRVANAAAAVAQAELEISRRGLVAATAGLFYGLEANERRIVILQQARDEANAFVQLTRKREAAREAAHADVIKAELTLEQRTRDLADGSLARDRARLELAVLLFADPMTPYTLTLPAQAPVLPPMADVQAAARRHNPEMGSALASLQQSNAEVLAAQAAYLPDLTVNFAYGIDAPEIAVNGPSSTVGTGAAARLVPTHNLGYSIGGTVDFPVWDWFATEHRVKQAEARRDAVRVALTAAQKRLIVNLQEDYAEAQTAQNEMASLETSVRTAEESLQLTQLRYASGEALVLEVVDAETALYAAQIAREDGQVRYEQALSTLETLTGTL